ncbi:MlaD family protein [Roseovarius sp. CAU 1744]|uniref:PqiB family protein n=1 Tax=Roseovarius sp. CAU 1744 TaxID=3140368 RepID=UPI00325B47BF
MSNTPPPVRIEPARQAFLNRFSIVWVIPLLALAIALGLAWQTYNDRGPVIEIEFQNGAGIAKRETELRYLDIAVGVVEDVEFRDDLSAVVISVRVDKKIAPYIDASSSFWIVRPELTTSGVSGLDTVLSGVYIEGSWDNEIGTAQTRFSGLEEPPLFTAGQEGLQIALRTTAGGNLTDNSPITYRGIKVGRVGKARISQEGTFAIAEAIIFEPHGNLISANTRFWDTSGFTFSVGPSGAELDFSSVATLLSGGLTFDTFVSGGARVSDGTVFQVYADEAAARSSIFNASEVETLEMRVVFEENVSGLSVGAKVELNGLGVGEVASVTGVIDPDQFGDSRVRLNAVLGIQPARLGLQEDPSPEAALSFLVKRIEEGLRARLASASLLTGGLKIELVQVDDAPPETVRTGEGIIPIFPTTESDITDTAASVEGVFNRINKLPVEELLNSAIDFLDSAKVLVSDEDLREMPQDLRALLADVRGIVASDDVQKIPATLNTAIVRFENILAQIEEEQLASRLVAAVDAAATAAEGVTASVEGVPALVEQIEAVAAKAERLPVEELTENLATLVASANEILATDAARDLPADLGAALNEIDATLSELREGGAVANINATLSSARDAADAVALSAQDLPALVERVERVLSQASTTIAGYNKGEMLSREAQAALRDISKAADAMASLARMLERNPGALIRGR